jgi:hypothetical protein
VATASLHGACSWSASSRPTSPEALTTLSLDD